MEKMIAFCGIICTKCPAFIATQDNDIEGRKKVAEMWSKEFQLELTHDDVVCDGCLAFEKRLSSYCKVCEIRKCGIEKKIQNCAYCNEYLCEKLSRHFMYAPEAKITLEEIRKRL